MTELERLNKALKFAFLKKNISKKGDMAEFLDYKSPYFSGIINGKEKLSESFLLKISDKLDINIDWILTGEGEMLKESANPKIIELKPRPMANVIMVPLVSQYAYAGYLAGYADAEYIGTLPTVPMIADHEPKGVYYAFEIKGDSMNDGTSKSLEEGDIIFGRQIQQNLWRYKLHIKKWNFVIVHKTEGILVKRILDHNPETGDIICHSLNPSPEYEDFTVNLNEVAQLFNVVQISRGMRE